ncbi:DUF3611 family protein [Microcoleus sp. FACHB-1515]|uniref:DUF3611 family protein n=1 Tax=Cyanophyceae TaxID=3028117 RepID=UPI0016866244|nr:DUF3611 family protein [Microcoleus sp. FACHB-1515]MBD2091703.1 DUF3611 family protein [Microcoleus sp. FACHB-1515]
MQAPVQTEKTHFNLDRVSSVLRSVGWLGIVIQLAFAAAAGLMVLFALTGRTFSQAIAPDTVSTGTPGLGISTLFASLGVIALLIGAFLAFRQTRFAKRLSNPNTAAHPPRSEVVAVLRSGIILGLIGMLLTIVGGSIALSVLLAKSISLPQVGVAVYDPTRIIRPIDVFVALANMVGIAGHFINTSASLSLFNWLHR